MAGRPAVKKFAGKGCCILPSIVKLGEQPCFAICKNLLISVVNFNDFLVMFTLSDAKFRKGIEAFLGDQKV